jgi:hypothetical protein
MGIGTFFSSGNNMRTVSTLLVTCTLLITFGLQETSAAPPQGKPYPILEPCSRYEPLYSSLFFKTEKFDDWPEKYHETVNEVIEEYMQPPEAIECLEPILLPLEATSALGGIARSLPPWQDPNDFALLDRNDVGIVMLEFLRVYECALVDHNYHLVLDVIEERFTEEAAGGPLPTVIQSFNYQELLKEMERRRTIILQEISVARPALERALQIITSIARLSPLDAEMHCLQRASLDLRNGLALTSDASVCLPKGWDAKDPLRDL